MPSGLAFGPLTEKLLDGAPTGITPVDDVYLVHRDSCVPAEDIGRYLAAATELARSAPGADRYLFGLRDAQNTELTTSELAGVAASSHVTAGLRVPKRSVDAVASADRLAGAVQAEPRIDLRVDVPVMSARPRDGVDGERLDGDERSHWVVNALWNGRLVIDVTAGLAPPPGWTNPCRVSALLRARQPFDHPS